MIAGAESHFRVYYYIICIAGLRLVEGGTDDAFASDPDGFEIILLPFLIPVLAFYPFGGVIDPGIL